MLFTVVTLVWGWVIIVVMAIVMAPHLIVFILFHGENGPIIQNWKVPRIGERQVLWIVLLVLFRYLAVLIMFLVTNKLQNSEIDGNWWMISIHHTVSVKGVCICLCLIYFLLGNKLKLNLSIKTSLSNTIFLLLFFPRIIFIQFHLPPSLFLLTQHLFQGWLI